MLEIGDTCYHPMEGDMFFIPPNTEMRYYPVAEEPVGIRVVYAKGRFSGTLR